VIDSEQLKALSACKQKYAVAPCCRKNKISFFFDAHGWPVTTAEQLNRALSSTAESGPEGRVLSSRPLARSRTILALGGDTE